MTKSSLTVWFESPFWIGIYERERDGKYEICKITFGAEPKDYEVYAYLLNNWHKLKFSPPIQSEKRADHPVNPKRMQREISKQLEQKSIGTKAQQALKLQREQVKMERRKRSREEQEAEKERQYLLRQERRKAKHKGR